MPFTNVKFSSGRTVRVEHEEDATDAEIRQLAKEKLETDQFLAEEEQGGSLVRTGMGLGADIAVAEGGKLAGTAMGAAIGTGIAGPAGTIPGAAVGYLISAIGAGAAGSYLRQKISRPGGKISEGQLVADVFINLLPYAKLGKGADLLARSTRQFAAGGAVAAGATTVESLIDQGNLPTLESLAKVGFTGGVLSVGLHMTGNAFSKSYQKYGGRKEEDILDGLRRRDPDAEAMVDGVMTAAIKHVQGINRKIYGKWTEVRENLDDELIRLLRLQTETANGWVTGGRLPEGYKGKGLTVIPDIFDPKTNKMIKGNDAYMYMTLSKGIIQQRIQILDFHINSYTNSLKIKSKEYNIPLADLNKHITEYLHARRALPFNAEFGDGAAGKTMTGAAMTNEYAEAVIAKFKFGEFRAFRRGTTDVTRDTTLHALLRPEVEILQKLAGNVRKTLYEGGIITEGRLKKLDKRPEWVSFRRVTVGEVAPGNADKLLFRGRDLYDPKSLKKPKGDERLQVNILDNLISSNLEAIRLAENNQAMLVFKRLLEDPLNRQTTSKLVRIYPAYNKSVDRNSPILTVFDPDRAYPLRRTGKPIGKPTDPGEPTGLGDLRQKLRKGDIPKVEDFNTFNARRAKVLEDMIQKEKDDIANTGRSQSSRGDIGPDNHTKKKEWTKNTSRAWLDAYKRPQSDFYIARQKEYNIWEKAWKKREKDAPKVYVDERGDPFEFGPDVMKSYPAKKYQTEREKMAGDELAAMSKQEIDESLGIGSATKFYMDFSEGLEPELAISIKGIHRSQLGFILKGFYGINKALGAMYTGFSPLSFTPANFVRDRMVGAMNTYKYLTGAAFRSILNPLEAAAQMNSIRRGLYTKKPWEVGYKKQQEALTPEQIILDTHREKWHDHGGPTGGIVTDLFSEIEEDMKGFDFTGNDFSLKAIKAKTRSFISFIRKVNEIVEDSTRFSVYLQHIKYGASPAEAAFYSKNASFNPKQMGLKGDHLKALYLFSNPTIQSTKNFWRSMKDPKLFKPVLAFTFGSALAIEMYNSLMDPDWRDKVKGGPDKSSWRLNKNVVVVSPFPNKDGSLSYTQVPLAHEVSPVWTGVNGMARLITGSTTSANEIIKETAKAIIDGYNPTGGSIVPTVPLRIAELTMLNKDGLGREIVPQRLLEENMAAYGKVHPWTAQTVGGEIAIELSKEIENLGAQVSPEKLGYLFQLSFGGLGQDIMRVFELVSKAYNGEEISTRDVPLFRRFFGSTYADAFEKRTGMEPDLKLFEYEQNTLSSKNYQDAFFILDKIKNIEDPDQKSMVLQAELAVANKSVSRRVRKILNDEAKGITRTDRQIRKLGVENGLRSEFYQEQIEKMAPEAVGQFLSEQKRKNILTDNVEKQLRIANALRTINVDESEGRGLPLISIGDPDFPKTKEELRKRRGADQLRPSWQPY